MKKQKQIRLTQFSHGAGCGCKIAPAVLDRILGPKKQSYFKDLLVGNDAKDDAAVMQINEHQVVISTTDFFMPIVDDPFDFGRIASANAISDIYAMAGKPLMAIAILGWPIDKIPVEIAGEVLNGARAICQEAGIPLAGGHSIDSPEPIFGLAVTGLAEKSKFKTNSGAQEGDYLFLTKPLGVGILSTASKKGLIQETHLQMSIDNMTRLNKIGYALGQINDVHAMTDVTGFGLLGHLIEMCEGSHVSAELAYQNIPFLPHVEEYLEKGCIPGGTIRNWKSYGYKVEPISTAKQHLLCDPQTSGGLLISVAPSGIQEFMDVMKSIELPATAYQSIGRIVKEGSKAVRIV